MAAPAIEMAEEEPEAAGRLRADALVMMESASWWEGQMAWNREMAGKIRRRAEEHGSRYRDSP